MRDPLRGPAVRGCRDCPRRGRRLRRRDRPRQLPDHFHRFRQLIISIGSGNRSEGDNFTSARLYIHSPEEIQSFFGGLELVPPSVIPVRCWYGDGPAPSLKPRTATFLGGVARKP